jgi:hypothetical protein
MNSTWRDGVSKISIITATYPKWGSGPQPLISLKNFDFPVFAFLKFNLDGIHMTRPAPNLISVLRDDHACLGFIKFSAKGYRAFDSDGREIGMYTDKHDAVRAIIGDPESTCRTAE